VEPARAFVTALGSRLKKRLPGIQAVPKVNGSIGRINRDTRFAKDKRPYNTHLHFRFWEGATLKDGGSGLAIWMGQDMVFFGAGMLEFTKPAQGAYRKAVMARAPGKTLADALHGITQAGYVVSEPHYKRVPAGVAPDHPRANLLRHSGLTAGRSVAIPKSVHSAGFVGFCAEQLEGLLPLHRWLMKHVG